MFRFTEDQAKFAGACVTEALDYLHIRGIFFRDLKIENLVLNKQGYVLLTDFGFAKRTPSNNVTYTFAGTIEYMAPELIAQTGHNKAVDCWALGVLIFELLTGKTPFCTNPPNDNKIAYKILLGIERARFPSYMSVRAKQLIGGLCKMAWSDRIGMKKDGMNEVRRHRWFEEFDWRQLQCLEMRSPIKPMKFKLNDGKGILLRDENVQDEFSGWDEKL